MGGEMVRFDFACKKCEKMFVVWSDEAKRCAYCGSKRVFKVFLTPTAISTGTASKIDNLAEKQLEAAGLSNFTNVGGTIKRTRKTDPKALEAVAVAKAHNIPITTGPQTGLEKNVELMRQQFKAIGAQGFIKQAGATGNKTVVTQNPRGTGALVQNIVQNARQTIPLSRLGPRYEPLPGRAKEDSEQLNKLLRK